MKPTSYAEDDMMREPKFKVGDRVKVTYMNPLYKGSMAWDNIGKEGKIVEIWEGDYDWPIMVKIDKDKSEFSKEELTLVSIKGKQLVFEFMEEEQ